MSTEPRWNKDQSELWALVQGINHGWYKGNPLQLLDFFHPDVVFNSPDFRQQIAGNNNCVQTYIDFMNNSKVLLYKEGNPTISIFANTAIVTYEFEMRYEQNGKTYHETGTDILVFDCREGSWKVVWRGLSNLKNK